MGLFFGIAAGLFFGESMGALKLVGDVFIRLLQMTVVPYVIVSLIAGLGRLDYQNAIRLGAWGGGLLVVLWGFAFGMVVVMPLAFPSIETGSFFSTSLIEQDRQVDFIQLYIPSNFFYALSNNIVPAVVVFSLAVGIALIGVDRKAALLESLDTLGRAMLRVTDFVVRFTPYGVFAISAAAAGTMTIEEFARVQVYVLCYVAFALISALWLLPGLVSALTPLRHGDVLKVSRDCLLTAFATGSTFVVIPLIAEHCKALLGDADLTREESDSLVDVIIPTSFSFPHSAKVLSLSFIVFAGWFSGSPLSASEYPTLAVSGVASVFGSISVAMPFLLDLMKLPQDLFQLFLATGVVNARFGTLVEAMHVLTLTLLGTCALTGSIRIEFWRLLRFVSTTGLLIALVVVGARAFFSVSVDTVYRKDQIALNMGLLLSDRAPSKLLSEQSPPRSASEGQSRLDMVVSSGVLRVCYAPRRPPFTHTNGRGELVGLDIELMNSLALGLDLVLEYVPVVAEFGRSTIADRLNEGHCDIGVSGWLLNMSHLAKATFSRPYLQATPAFLVEDHRRQEFRTRERVDANPDLRIAFPNDPYYLRRAKEFVPNAQVIPVDDVRSFLEAEAGEYDALFFPGEKLGAYSLMNPRFGVVVPAPGFQAIPIGFLLPLGEPDWRATIDAWVELKTSDGTTKRLFDYWALGKQAEVRRPRWSVVRDVLHWRE